MRRPDPVDETGAQALELAMALPLIAMAVIAVLALGTTGAVIVRTQQAAVLLARTAAVAGDDTVHGLAEDAGVTATVTPAATRRRAGDLVTVAVTRVLALPGMDLPITLSATARAEVTPGGKPP